MKKVLRILNRFNVGGPTHNAIYLTKYLEPEFKTKLIGGKHLKVEASSEYLLIKHGINYQVISNMSRSLSLLKDLKAFLEIIKIIKEYKPDIVHTHASKSGALGRFAAIICKVPIIIHTFHGHVFHSYFGTIKTKLFIFLERFLAKKSTAIIAISNLQKKELVEIYRISHESKIFTIPLGFDLERFQTDLESKRTRFRNEFQLSKNDISIGIIGRLTAIKNQEFFLKSIHSILQKSMQPVKVFIIGDGEDRNSLEMLANDLNIPYKSKDKRNSIIHFTSWRKDMEAVYAGLDIVALTSLNEGTPVALIEAQAANKPIIANNVGGVMDVVLDNQTAIVINGHDTIEFGEKLLTLIENDDLRKKMGSAGYDHVKDLYSYKRLVNDVKSLYTLLMSQKHIN